MKCHWWPAAKSGAKDCIGRCVIGTDFYQHALFKAKYGLQKKIHKYYKHHINTNYVK